MSGLTDFLMGLDPASMLVGSGVTAVGYLLREFLGGSRWV